MSAKIHYTSPVFSHADGSSRKFLIPADALTTYAKRDECLFKMHQMGGIYAKPTPEFLKLRSKMLAAKRKIERMGWFSITVN
jgi:hypothetical protein